MEQEAALISSSAGNFIKSTQKFELELFERLKWNKERWSSTGEAGTRINRLCSSMHYWKGKLKPAIESASIVITLFNSEKDVKLNFIDIIHAVESLDKSFVVKGFADFRNPRYLCLYFENEEITNNVKEKFRMVGDNYVVFLSWALGEETRASFLKVHWLPMTFNIDIIKSALNKYVECIEEQRKIFKFMSGREMPSGKVSFKVVFKKEVTADAIPHLMKIADMEALITVSGRKPLCLNCDILGHVSKDCKQRFCNECRMMMPRGHNCDPNASTRSYANTVKLGGDMKSREPDDWGAEIVFNDNDQNDKNNSQIAEKIVEIENKIKLNEAIESSYAQLGLDLKHKMNSVELDEEEDEERSSDSNDEAGKKMICDNGIELTQEQGPQDNTENRNGKVKKIKEQKKKHKSGKKKVNSLPFNLQRGKTVNQNLSRMESSEDDLSLIRSYGKPVVNNPRKLREQKNFDKLVTKSTETREFIFTD